MPSPSLEPLTTFLFKYPPRVFQRGDFVLAPVIPALALGVAALLAIALVVVMYSRVRAVPRRDQFVLGTVRTLAVLILFGCLLRPTVVLSSAVAQRNVLAVLLDDSRSMRLKDVDGSSRLAAVQRVFADSAALMRKLGDKFAVRVFRFAADASPTNGAASLRAAGTRTDLAGALDVTREDLSGMPLAGVIVVTDGADNGGGDLGTALLALRARRVPVYTVGVGQERFARDVAVERASAPATVLAGSTVLVDAAIGIRGAGGDKTTVTAEANGRVVASEEITLPSGGDVTRVRLRVPPLAPGTYEIAVKVRPLRDEPVTENNEYHTMLEVRPGPVRVLYVEGEPRPEFAFLRRAIAEDSSLQLVALLRSAEHKFLRLGVQDSLELVSGFPVKREELFRYRAVVLGSVEASFFTGDQLRMLGEFVNQRGGSLLALGGRSALSEGGYAETPVADVLPLVLNRTGRDTGAAPLTLAVHPTPAGVTHAALQLGASEAASSAKWDSLPSLTNVNEAGSLRAGATVLLNGRVAGPGKNGIEVPVLASQRYGRGLGAILNVQDTWLWRMSPTLPVEDQTYSTFWRQMLRWLVEGVPDQVEIAAVPARVGPGEPLTLRARVADSTFQPVNGANVVARVTSPSGITSDVALEWSLKEDGTYTGRYITSEAGAYRMTAEVRRGRDTLRSKPASLLADDQGADVEQAEQRTPLLKRVSRETGGRYYPIADAGKLADDVMFTESGVTVRESRDLWDAPIVFLMLALLLATEWTYRRARGLA